MARTNKKGGNTANLKNIGKPFKFLGNIGKAISGGDKPTNSASTAMVGDPIGMMTGENALMKKKKEKTSPLKFFDPEYQHAKAKGDFTGNKDEWMKKKMMDLKNEATAQSFNENTVNLQQPTPLTKKKKKKNKKSSPLKGADPVLVAGAGDVARAGASDDLIIANTIAGTLPVVEDTVMSGSKVNIRRNLRAQKRQIKANEKLNRWIENRYGNA